jgi:hypothetical protein
MCDSMKSVDFEHFSGCSSYVCRPNEARAVPSKVQRPCVGARIEQASQYAGLWIEAGEVRTFVAIACETCQRKIGLDGKAAVFLRLGVFDFKGQWIELLRHLAVFASRIRPLPNESPKRSLHQVVPFACLIDCRALD